jgi:chromosomal replication initiator protein
LRIYLRAQRIFYPGFDLSFEMDGAVVEHEVFAIPLACWAGSSPTPDAAVSGVAGNGTAHSGEAASGVASSCAASSDTAGSADFIVGPENRLAGTVARWFLQHDAHWYSPLVLCGPSGTGKSHLAQAIAQSQMDAVCTHGAEFARELATAVDRDAVAEFRTRYRSAGVFVLEDLLQLTGRRAALLELQHLLDVLEDREAPVVITSHRPPAEVAELPPALRSRLSGGLAVAVSSPGIAARQSILERWAAARGITLSTPAAKLLAEQLNVTAAELRGTLTELEMAARTQGKPQNHTDVVDAPQIDVQHVRRFLLHRRAQRRPSLKQVSTLVAKYYGLKPAVLGSPSRRRQVVLSRAVAIYLGRTLCGASLKALGKHFGGRDHSTALHNFRQLQHRLAHDAELSGTVATLQRLLVGGG